MTELDAVNAMLRAIGEAPVNDLDEDSDVSEASIARGVLHEISREIQDLGLECNTESDYPMTIDSNGFIYLSDNIIRIDPMDPTLKVVQRGNRLYDAKNHTYVFTKTLKCEVQWFLPFDDLPHHAAAYIAIVALRRFVGDVLGDEGIKRLSVEDYQRVVAQFRRAENDAADATYLDAPGMYNMLRRS
jgi:hypothetical protein